MFTRCAPSFQVIDLINSGNGVTALEVNAAELLDRAQ